MDSKQLLEHSGWMRSLALSLVKDDARADDIVQQTWLAAVEHPPQHKNMGAWLNRVLRNFAYRSHRDEMRRHKRESATASPEISAEQSPQDLLEKTELHKQLVEIVLHLDEPHRSTIILRFFEGLSQSQISKNQNIPYTTVCSRLNRGLELIRNELDSQHGGDRKQWMGILSPLIGTSAFALSAGSAGTAVAATATTTTLTTKLSAVGAFVMSQKLIYSVGFSVATIALLLTGFMIGVKFEEQKSSQGLYQNDRTLLSQGSQPKSPTDEQLNLGNLKNQNDNSQSEQASPQGNEGSSSSKLDEKARKNLLAALGKVKTPLWTETEETSTGSITGFISNEKGVPIAGVQVKALPISKNPQREFTSLEDEKLLIDQILNAVETHRNHSLALVSSVTDENGWYQLDGIKKSTLYEIVPFHEGLKFKPADGSENENARIGSVVDFQAIPTATITLDIKFSDGKVPDVSKIHVREGYKTRGIFWYPENPSISLPQGTYRLRAFFGSERTHMSEPKFLTISSSEQKVHLEMELQARNGIIGHVNAPIGEAPKSLHTYLLKLDGNPNVSNEELANKGVHRVAKGPYFKFWFKDLEPGNYLIGVGRFEKEIVTSHTVEIGEEFKSTEIELPALSPEDYLELTVLNPDGENLSNVKIWTESRGVPIQSLPITRPDGKIWLLYSKDTDRSAEHRIVAESTLYGRESTLGAGLTEATIQFKEPASLLVYLENYEKSAALGSVKITLRGGADRGNVNYRRSWKDPILKKPLSQTGVQEFTSISPGEYTVWVNVNRTPTLSKKVNLIPGENEVRLTLPSYYSLTVITEGNHVMAYRRGGSTTNRVLFSNNNQNGRFLFPLIEEGQYLIKVDGNGSMPVDVYSNSEIAFQSELPAQAVPLRVAENDSNLARAGFQDGDLLLGIEIEGQAQPASIFKIPKDATEVNYVVWRNGKNRVISADPKLVGRNLSLGLQSESPLSPSVFSSSSK